MSPDSPARRPPSERQDGRTSLRVHAYPSDRPNIEARLVKRARSDSRFHAMLLAEPRKAIAEELGLAVPESLAVQVVQETRELMCVVLPVDLSGIGADAIRAATGRS